MRKLRSLIRDQDQLCSPSPTTRYNPANELWSSLHSASTSVRVRTNDLFQRAVSGDHSDLNECLKRFHQPRFDVKLGSNLPVVGSPFRRSYEQTAGENGDRERKGWTTHWLTPSSRGSDPRVGVDPCLLKDVNESTCAVLSAFLGQLIVVAVYRVLGSLLIYGRVLSDAFLVLQLTSRGNNGHAGELAGGRAGGHAGQQPGNFAGTRSLSACHETN